MAAAFMNRSLSVEAVIPNPWNSRPRKTAWKSMIIQN